MPSLLYETKDSLGDDDFIEESEIRPIQYDEEAMAQMAKECEDQEILRGLDKLIERCTKQAAARNWSQNEHDKWSTFENPYFVPGKLCLIHSEVSEAMEGDRRDSMDDKLPNYKAITVEIADAFIRMAHLIGLLQQKDMDNFERNKFDLAKAIIDKLEFNMIREDHKMEARNATGGKRY